MTYEKYIQRRLEKIELRCPTAKRTEVMESLARAGWHLGFCGPYSTKRMFPRVSTTKYVIHAEREVAEK